MLVTVLWRTGLTAGKLQSKLLFCLLRLCWVAANTDFFLVISHKITEEGKDADMVSCVWTRRPFSGRREGEHVHVCCGGESTGERSWGFVALQ